MIRRYTMSKSERQAKILDIIKRNVVETQDDLVAELQKQGYKATQATVSRDIKELHLVKSNVDDRSRYTVMERAVGNDIFQDAKMKAIFREVTKEVLCVNNFIVVKSKSGMANTAAALLDDGVEDSNKAGTIAGDDTVFVMMLSNESASRLANSLKELLTNA